MQRYIITYEAGGEVKQITLSAPNALHALDLVELSLGGTVTRLTRITL